MGRKQIYFSEMPGIHIYILAVESIVSVFFEGVIQIM